METSEWQGCAHALQTALQNLTIGIDERTAEFPSARSFPRRPSEQILQHRRLSWLKTSALSLSCRRSFGVHGFRVGSTQNNIAPQTQERRSLPRCHRDTKLSKMGLTSRSEQSDLNAKKPRTYESEYFTTAATTNRERQRDSSPGTSSSKCQGTHSGSTGEKRQTQFRASFRVKTCKTHCTL